LQLGLIYYFQKKNNMKQKDLITYGLIGLAIVFLMNQSKADDKKDEPENGGIKTPATPVEEATFDPVPDGTDVAIQL